MAECDHFKDNDESMLGTLADGTVECAMCKAQFVPASRLGTAEKLLREWVDWHEDLRPTMPITRTRDFIGQER